MFHSGIKSCFIAPWECIRVVLPLGGWLPNQKFMRCRYSSAFVYILYMHIALFYTPTNICSLFLTTQVAKFNNSKLNLSCLRYAVAIMHSCSELDFLVILFISGAMFADGRSSQRRQSSLLCPNKCRQIPCCGDFGPETRFANKTKGYIHSANCKCSPRENV